MSAVNTPGWMYVIYMLVLPIVQGVLQFMVIDGRQQPGVCDYNTNCVFFKARASYCLVLDYVNVLGHVTHWSGCSGK